MNRIVKFLNDCNTFYLATVENDQPRVRPFGAATELDEKIYICTSNQKDVYKQLLVNSKFEISATLGDKWIRISGTLTPDHSLEAKEAFLKANPSLTNMYSVNDGVFEVLYITDATATFYSFQDAPETITV